MEEIKKNAIRVDLLDVYERIKRMSAMRARGIPDHTQRIAVTDDDHKLINPLIIQGLSELADDVGVIELAQDTPIDKLSEELMKDGFVELLENQQVDETERREAHEFLVSYRLPGEGGAKYKTGAVAELVYHALANYALKYWYEGLGMYDDMNLKLMEYERLVRKIRNHSYQFKNKKFERPYISL